MKDYLALTTTLLCLNLTHAQEVIEPEKLEPVAQRLIERASDQENLPLKVDGDAIKAFGLKAKDRGVIVIPQKGLTADSVKKAGAEPVAIGQLWLARLIPTKDGSSVGADQLRQIKVSLKDQEYELPLLLLAVQKKDDKPELLVYAKDKAPLLRLPLKKVESKQDLPIEVDVHKVSETTGMIDLSILGTYAAGIEVGVQE